MNVNGFESHGIDIVKLVEKANKELLDYSESYNKLFMNIKKMNATQNANFYDMWQLDTNLRFSSGRIESLDEFVAFDNFISMLDYNLEDDGCCYLVEWKINGKTVYNIPSHLGLERDLSEDKHYGFWTREIDFDRDEHLISQIRRKIDSFLPIFTDEQKKIDTIEVRYIYVKASDIFDIIGKIDASYDFNLDEVFNSNQTRQHKFTFEYKK